MRGSVLTKGAIALGLAVLLLQACSSSTINLFASAVTQAESFRYSYLRLRADTGGRYVLPVRGIGGGCTAASVTESEIKDALRTSRIQIQHVRSGSPPVSAPVTVAFDLDADLDACGMGRIVEHGVDTLQVVTLDSSGAVTNRSRAAGVEAKYGNDGIARISVQGFLLNGQVASRSHATGQLYLPTFEVAAGQVQGTRGARYSSENVASPYAQGTVTTIEHNPERVGIEFRFMAKPAPDAGEILLVWGGSLMMRTDL